MIDYYSSDLDSPLRLPSNDITDIKIDKNNNLWLIHRRGLSKIILEPRASRPVNIKNYIYKSTTEDNEYLYRIHPCVLWHQPSF